MVETFDDLLVCLVLQIVDVVIISQHDTGGGGVAVTHVTPAVDPDEVKVTEVHCFRLREIRASLELEGSDLLTYKTYVGSVVVVIAQHVVNRLVRGQVNLGHGLRKHDRVRDVARKQHRVRLYAVKILEKGVFCRRSFGVIPVQVGSPGKS